jgi:hypothetical protein
VPVAHVADSPSVGHTTLTFTVDDDEVTGLDIELTPEVAAPSPSPTTTGPSPVPTVRETATEVMSGGGSGSGSTGSGSSQPGQRRPLLLPTAGLPDRDGG